MMTRVLLPAPNGPLAGLEAAPPGAAAYHSSAVLVPGHGAKEDFVPLMHLLALDGHRVLTLDHRGQHESAGPADPAERTPAALARDLEVALTAAAARRPVHLVGHGFGASIAARVLAAAPGKCSTFTVIGTLDADLVPAVAASGVPALVLEADQHPDEVPVGGRTLAAQLGARLLRVSGARGVPHLDSPTAVAEGLLSLWRAHERVHR